MTNTGHKAMTDDKEERNELLSRAIDLIDNGARSFALDDGAEKALDLAISILEVEREASLSTRPTTAQPAGEVVMPSWNDFHARMENGQFQATVNGITSWHRMDRDLYLALLAALSPKPEQGADPQ